MSRVVQIEVVIVVVFVLFVAFVVTQLNPELPPCGPDHLPPNCNEL